jgi:hypothetical protein
MQCIEKFERQQDGKSTRNESLRYSHVLLAFPIMKGRND